MGGGMRKIRKRVLKGAAAVIFRDDANSLYPKICWNGNRWCAAWDLNDSDDVYFAY